MLLEAYKQIPTKILRESLYACLQQCDGNTSLYIKLKWEEELQTALLVKVSVIGT